MTNNSKERLRTRNSDRTIALLKQATIEQLISNGFSGLSIIPIIKKAGVSRGALFHHFASKDDLIAAAFEDLLEEFADRMNKISIRLREGKIGQEAFVAEIGEAFASDLFIACMEMSLGIRSEHFLSDSVEGAIRKWRAALQTFWTETFDLPGLSEEEAVTHWAMASNTLRGHGFTTSFGLESQATDHLHTGFAKIYLRDARMRPLTSDSVLSFEASKTTTQGEKQ